MMEDYEQMELDTRKELTKAVDSLAAEAVGTVRRMVQNCNEEPAAVRNRHEAYGIASEHFSKIAAATKTIKNDLGTLLGTLADPNAPAIEATASIRNSVDAAVSVLLLAAAEMDRTLDNLYTAERNEDAQHLTPMEEYAATHYEDADPEAGDDE